MSLNLVHKGRQSFLLYAIGNSPQSRKTVADSGGNLRFIHGIDVNMSHSVGDEIESVEVLEQIPLFSPGIGSLETIRLGDIANIRITDNSARTYAKINGENGVLLSFSKQSMAARSSGATRS